MPKAHVDESIRRLIRDLKKLKTDPTAGIAAAPINNDIYLWEGIIIGPADTPFDGGVFKLSLEFGKTYPNKAPTVKFVTPIFHPNVYGDGRICLDILQNQWSPVYDVAAVLLSIQSLLSDPNPLSPANYEAARLYTENRTEYNRRVKQTIAENKDNKENTETKENSENLHVCYKQYYTLSFDTDCNRICKSSSKENQKNSPSLEIR